MCFTGNHGNLSCAYIGKEGQLVNNTWQPTGCSMHTYTSSEFQTCLIKRRNQTERSNHILIIGDSVMRQRYRALQSLIENNNPFFKKNQHEEGQKYPNISTRIEYKFLPEAHNLVNFLGNWHVRYRNSTPDTIIVGFSYWKIAFAFPRKSNAVSEKYLTSYTNEVRQVIKMLEIHCNTTTTCVWVNQGPVNSTAIRRRNMPIHKNKWWQAINQYNIRYPNSTETIIDLYNDKALEVVKNFKKLSIWEVLYPIGKLYLNETQSGDGVHVSTKVLLLTRQIMANYMCNTITRFPDATCCTKNY